MSLRRLFRPTTLSAQVLAIQLLIVVVTLVAVAVAGYFHVRDTLYEQYGQRALAVARTVADLPETHQALVTGDPERRLQDLVETIRVDAGLTYIAVADEDGIRLTHPNPERIGERLSTDPSDALAGRTVITTETGTLGPTVRAKVPIFDEDRAVIGLVSAGISTSEINRHTWLSQRPVILLGAGALALGVVASVVVGRRLRRKTFGLAPSEIATLYEHREAMLLAIREGVVTLDAEGRITLINGEARRLLGIEGDVEGVRLTDRVRSIQLAALLDGRYEGATTIVSQGRVLVVSRRPVSVRDRQIGAVITLRDRTELEGLVSELASVKGMADSLRAKTHEYSNRMHTIAGLIELGYVHEAARYATDESRLAQALSESYANDLGDPTLVALLMSKSAVAAERGIELRVVRDEAMLTARLVDAHDAVTVIGNLIDNAFDAVLIGGRDESWVEIDLRADGTTLIVSVRDSGPGVAAEDAAHIFEYGYSTKTSAEDGVRWQGIGLALVAETAERHGGTVSLVPEDRRGASFVVTLGEMIAATPAPEVDPELVGR
jgi:two-component system, CitB family, sensor kinase